MTDIPNSRKSTPRRKIGKRFIQAWVDKKTGHVYCYFRRAGYPRVPLPGLPGSAELEAAYAAALGNAPSEIGIGRNQHGSVAHAVASYFGSTDFCNRLTPSTQAIRRVLLEKFRRDYGETNRVTAAQVHRNAVEHVAPRCGEKLAQGAARVAAILRCRRSV